VRVRRVGAAARWLRLLARVPGRARVPRHPGAVHRGRHGRDPAELHRSRGARRRPAVQRRLEVRVTYLTPKAAEYRATGGPWDQPTLDALLSDAATRAADRVLVVDGDERVTGAQLMA